MGGGGGVLGARDTLFIMHNAQTPRKGRHDDLVSTLCMTNYDPPCEKSSLRPWCYSYFNLFCSWVHNCGWLGL